MEPAVRNRYLVGLIGVGAAVVALLILPFAGFTEKTLYWYSYELTGIGTWGEGLNFFEYPATLFYVSIVLLVAVVLLIAPLRMLWAAYRRQEQPAKDERARAAKVTAVVALGVGGALLLTMFVLLPAVEDETIWLVESGGFLTDWWPSYGAFVAIVGAGVASWALRAVESPSAPAPPPPPPK